MTSTTTTASRATGEWLIQDCASLGATLRVDGARVDAVINGQVVSTGDGMNACAMLVALGGAPPRWYATVQAARNAMADIAALDPDPDPVDVSRAIRCLTQRRAERHNVAVHGHTRTAVATLRLIVLARDPNPIVRERVAASLPLAEPVGRQVALRLAAEPDAGVAARLLRARNAATDDDVLTVLARHPDERLRCLLAKDVPLRSRAARILSVDTSTKVRAEIAERLGDEDDPDFDDLALQVVVVVR
jgi:hypothetical protein